MQIQELCDLLPAELVPNIGPGQAPGSKPNKGSVLRRGVDYIKMLHHDMVALEQRCKDLEDQLRSLGIDPIEGKNEMDMDMTDFVPDRPHVPPLTAPGRARR